MEYDYTECKTCARKGDTFCIGCQPKMLPDGTFSRSLYTQTKEELHITSQSDTSEVMTMKPMTNRALNPLVRNFHKSTTARKTTLNLLSKKVIELEKRMERLEDKNCLKHYIARPDL